MTIEISLRVDVRDSGSRRLVNDALNREPRNGSGILGRLALRVVEIGGHRYNGVLHLATQKCFGGLLHLPKVRAGPQKSVTTHEAAMQESHFLLWQ
jgi:hypothetical protein